MASRLIAALLALSFATTALGQQQVPFSDADSHAAYCIGVLEDEIAFFGHAVSEATKPNSDRSLGPLPLAPNPDLQEVPDPDRRAHDMLTPEAKKQLMLWDATRGRLTNAHEALLNFVELRATGLDSRAPSRYLPALAQATTRGRQEWGEFLATNNRCKNQCPYDPKAEGPFQACLKSCTNPELVARVLSCENPTWLPPNRPPAVQTEPHAMLATVQAIYPDKRSVTVVGPDRLARSVFVLPDVRLDRMRAGDKVSVTYYQGMAAQMARGDLKVSDVAAANSAYKNPGGTNVGGVGSWVTVTVIILGVDPGPNSVKFQEADGSQHTIRINSARLRDFIKTLKPGDKVDVTYTESVATNVTPAA
jgi:hypothetical protein